MDALILERPVNLEFIEIIHEIVIVLLSQEPTKLEVRLNLPNLILGNISFSSLHLYQGIGRLKNWQHHPAPKERERR